MNMSRVLFAVGCLAFAMLCHACVTEHKAIGAGATVTALRVETGASTASGNPLPNVILGGGAVAYASAPKGESVHVFASRKSWLGRVLGIESGDSVEIWINNASPSLVSPSESMDTDTGTLP